MQDLVIFGAGGLAREVYQIVEEINEAKGDCWNVIGFLDDRSECWGLELGGVPILGGQSWLRLRPDLHVVVAIGNTAARHRVVNRLLLAGHGSFASLVHPNATVGRRVQVGLGSIICAGAVITTNVVLGNHVIVHYNSTVGHDATVADYVTISPGANISGSVRVEEGCDLGTNSTVLQGLSIGHWTIVGAGAVVNRNLPANVTVVGVPAKPIKERFEGWHLV